MSAVEYDACIWIYMDYAGYKVIGFSTPATSNKMFRHYNYIDIISYNLWFLKYRAFTFNANLRKAIDDYFRTKGFTP